MTWQDQTSVLRTFSTMRGRPFNLDRIEAGTASFEFKNPAGDLDPANAGSPYYPDILPLKEIWVSRIEEGLTYNRFRGPIERYKPVWQPPHHQLMAIEAADAFETLSSVPIISGTAAMTTALTGANNDLTFTARRAGGQGDDITVSYVVAGNNTPLAVGTNDPLDGGAAIVQPMIPSSFAAFLALFGGALGGGSIPSVAPDVNPVTLTVQGTDITVTVATSAGGAATSTAAQIKTALDANAEVMALVSVALAPANDGSGVVTAMSATNLTGGKWASETTGERITRVLDEAGWPADKRLLDAGIFSVIEQGFSEADNASALSHMQDVADSELGYVFIDGNGNFVFHDGGHRSREERSIVPQATFADDGNGFPYVALDYDLGKDRIFNRVTVTAGAEGSLPQTVEDPDSQLAYSGVEGVAVPRNYAKATLLTDDADALTLAEAILEAYKDPRTRFESITVLMPATGVTDWVEAVFALEIGDLVTVRTNPPVEPSATPYTITYDCFVESIADAVAPGQPWSVTFQLTPVSESLSTPPPGGGEGAMLDSSGDPLELDSATLGLIG